MVASAASTNTLVVGTMYGPIDLDPIYAWDSASIDVIDQVVEGLYAYDLGDPSLALIPRLASAMGTWNVGATEYTVPLRTGVKFHDGTDFNAYAVVAHWDRIEWALNTTGSNTVVVTQVAELYKFPDGTPIVDHVTDNGDNTVTFFLNGPYIPFVALLCFSASYIQSPTYITSLSNTYIDTSTEIIVGTGPFKYISYEAGVEVLFDAFDDYWGGRATLDHIVLSEIIDANARNAALLSGDIDLLLVPMNAMLQVYNFTTGITLEQGPLGTVTQYLGMNNNLINRTWREAISYAIDYEYILDELRLGNAERMKSPIPQGIMYADDTNAVATLDLVHARTIMQSMGFGVGFNINNDAEWEAASFKTYNYTYNIGNSFREDMLVLLQDNLAKIGITITDAGGTWPAFVDRLNDVPAGARNELELFFIGWGPNYNDPSNFINPLFTNRSVASNAADYNGYLAAIEDGRDPFALNDNVQLLMEAAISETNAVTRAGYYGRIQELLTTRDFPWAFCYVSKSFRAYVDGMTGYDLNPMGREWWYPISFTSIADSLSITTPDSSSSWKIDTIHSITWTSTGSIANVMIDLYWKGTFNTTISASTPNNGSYSWTIPSGLDDSTLYYIKISDVSNPSTYDYSDYFEIYILLPSAGSITVTNPSGIAVWEIGTIHSITWTATSSIVNVKIELYISGILDSVLTSGTPNDGEISWTIPSGLTNSTQYQIKILDVSNPSTYDYSDYFGIYNPNPSITEEIPGYNLYFLYMIIGIISVLLIKKKYKHLKK
ncbi:hypothetical protein LCGC14_1505450 [marine sediment metagenome]|uniref:Uncharacterized protein n=1 Tax=marine sediment metagenome TaxID=412755 RepID=A0A0F9J2V8_9ZZZZ